MHDRSFLPFGVRSRKSSLARNAVSPLAWLLAATCLVGASTSSAQTVTGGLVTTREDLEGVRYRALGTSGQREIFLGVPDLGVGGNRTERDIVWAPTNSITFTYDRPNDLLETVVTNVNGTYPLVYSNISTQLGVLGKTFTVDDLDFMRIGVFARDAGTTVELNDVELDGNPLGDFTTAFVDHWMVSQYDFSAGFTVTATVVLAGTFSSGENSKIELSVGKANVCGNGILELTEECDDGNTLGGDCCDANCQIEPFACDDGDACTTGDTCTAGGCEGVPVNCDFLDDQCNDGQCDALTGECVSVHINEGGPCDDGDACSLDDVCIDGICSACGNTTVDVACGETCDPPASGVCDGTCQTVACGNGIVQTGEECDDGNTANGDGCSSECLFEEKLCLEGTQPSVSRQAKRVAFASDFDYVGQNPDGNREIFLFERKKFDKAVRKKVKREGIDVNTARDQLLASSATTYFRQLTSTPASVLNEFPTLNGSARVVAFVSNGDLRPGAPGNADGNREIFRLDVKRNDLVQVTDSAPGIDNLNPNLRAFRGNLLSFDSNGDFVPGKCVGGEDDGVSCANNGQCSSGACGNPEGNREIFVYVHSDLLRGRDPLRQLTGAASGESTVGQNANFAERSTAFSSTADLLGVNPEGNREIYRVEATADSLTAVTVTASGDHREPAQAVRDRIAFTSNADLTPGAPGNVDGNREVFFSDGGTFRQIGSTMGCINAAPSIDNRGRFVAFQSTCNRIPSLGNPDQSIFVWDDKKTTLLPLVIRGEANAASASPQATKAVSVLTYETNLTSIVDPGICFLNVRNFLKTLESQP